MELRKETVIELIQLFREMNLDRNNKSEEETFDDILETHPNQPKIVELIDNLSDQEKSELLALMWFGRNTPDDWEASLDTAMKEPTDLALSFLEKQGKIPEFLSRGISKLKDIGIELN